MVDATYFLALKRSIEQAPTTSSFLERWLDRTKELQEELSWQVVLLSRYIDELPKSSYASYADALISALQDPELEPRAKDVCDFESRVREFARKLEECGYPQKATPLIEALRRECRSEE
jgi:hypothetical protein